MELNEVRGESFIDAMESALVIGSTCTRMTVK